MQSTFTFNLLTPFKSLFLKAIVNKQNKTICCSQHFHKNIQPIKYQNFQGLNWTTIFYIGHIVFQIFIKLLCINCNDIVLKIKTNF